MKMKTYQAGPLDANNYLLWDENTKKAVLIDCSEFLRELIADVERLKLSVKYILITHGHFDHILGAGKLAKAFSSKLAIHKNDLVLSDNINEFSTFVDFPHTESPKYDFYVNDGDVIEFGENKIRVIHTPGHTEGGVCYLVNDEKLFCGDTLFCGSYGRTDLFGGDFDKIYSSITEKLFKLNDNVEVYPGHGESSSIGFEKKYNEINNR